ncbi:MAG: multidrug effflux MFS transporter [Betaproteobacteria bacterium]|nr:multidrug effflux MFS transporter [Betaproteobacteria bacterium]
MPSSSSPQNEAAQVSNLRIALVVAALGAIGPFSIDAYLPSFAEIGASLSASRIEVQQTLSAYLLPFAVMSLWHGAISDAFGRRRVILVALTLFAAASLGCALATRIEMLWLMRAMQGICAGAGIVIGRALVRDLYHGVQAQKLMSSVALMFALAPAIAPVIGGWLHSWFGWRSVFYFLFAFTMALFAACLRWLPETLPLEKRQPFKLGYLAHAYGAVLTSPRFMLICLALTLNFMAFFVYVASAPIFLMEHLKLDERGFLWLFGPTTAGIICGSFISGHSAGKLSTGATLRLACALMGSAALINLAVAFLLPPGLPWSVLPLSLYTAGMSLAAPTLTLAALDLFPEKRGLAASCQTFIQSAGNALLAGLLAPLLWHTPRTLALGMCGFFAVGLLLLWGSQKLQKPGAYH